MNQRELNELSQAIDEHLTKLVDELRTCDCCGDRLHLDDVEKEMGIFMGLTANGMTMKAIGAEVVRRWPDSTEHQRDTAVRLANALCAARREIFEDLGIETISTRELWN